MIGFLLFVGLLSIELGIFLRSYKLKVINSKFIRNIRILTLTLIIMLTLFGVLTFSFRYYGLFLLLFFMIAFNDIKALKNLIKPTPYTNKATIKKLLLNSLIITLIMIPSGIFPEYKPLATTGGFEVTSTTFVFEDENRIDAFSNDNALRQVGVHAWYPGNTNETFPLIVYSHGGISLETSNESLFLELASHGYVVFSIGHPYHSIVTKNIKGDNIWINGEYMRELNRESAKENPIESFGFYQKWMQVRTNDLNFIIDYAKIESQNTQSLPVFKLIDIENIGVIGHSLGGSAALCIGRNRNDVKAIIALESPYMCDILGVENETFIFDSNAYPIPVLNVYSDSTWSQLSSLPQYKQNSIMLNDSESMVVNVHIDGTGHFSLTDLSLTSPLMTRMLNGFRSTRQSRDVLSIINIASLEFLDNWLKE